MTLGNSVIEAADFMGRIEWRVYMGGIMALGSTKGYRDTSLKIAGDELENELLETNSATLLPGGRCADGVASEDTRLSSRVHPARPAAASVPVPVPLPAGESLDCG